MPIADDLLAHPRPSRIREVPRVGREPFHPSPADWRDEVLYFLLPDRFSDGGEAGRPLLDRADLDAARPAPAGAGAWQWDRWSESGKDRWQGGTIRGITSKLGYLQGLGITTVWVGPVFKQRGHLDTYHGYGIQDFLEVDPHFGSRRDLRELVAAAHRRGMRIILDVIFNHSGANFDYLIGGRRVREAGFLSWPGFHPSIVWRGATDEAVAAPAGPDEGVWPVELQDPSCYARAGTGRLDAGDIDDPRAEHKRTDFGDLRDLSLETPGAGLGDPGTPTLLVECYKYWIALTDCDGFRIDTLKHVSLEQGRNFCGAIKEFAARLGKHDFFLVGEVAGGDFAQDRYLDVLGLNLNAALDIGEMRGALTAVAKGLEHPSAYFDGFDPGKAVMGSHRNLGRHHVSIVDDHDHVSGPKVRFSADAASRHQIVAATALQLLTLGIPCVYYGSEQGLAGPEASVRGFLPGWGSSDRYLREALFGPEHARRGGRAGIPAGTAGADPSLPGFGPFGTAGRHCFDDRFPAYRRIAALARTRADHRVLRSGRQYMRPTRFLGRPFGVHGPGELLAWSRLLDDEEALCVVNTHGLEARGADVVVDATLNPPATALTVVLNTLEAAGAPAVSHPGGSTVPVRRAADGTAFVEIRDLPASEVLVLLNQR